MLLRVPLAVEGPQGCSGVIGGTAGGGAEVVGEPTAMASLALVAIVVDALSQGTGVEDFSFLGHLLGSAALVGVLDVLVEDVVRHLTADEIELGVVVIASKGCGALGVELGIGDDELHVVVATTVVPDDGMAVA